MSEYMDAHQIQHELTAPYSPAQNGKAERFNRTLIEMTKSLLKNIPSLAHELWPYAVDHATWLYNRIPQEGLEKKSPYELLHSHCPDLSGIKPFGTECWYNDTPTTNKKANDKGKPGIYLGNANGSDAHLILTADGKTVITRLVKFASSTSNLVDRHKSFYQTELKRREAEAANEEKETTELIPSGTKSRPLKASTITGHALLVKHMNDSTPTLSKLVKSPIDGHLWGLAAPLRLTVYSKREPSPLLQAFLLVHN